MRTRMDSFKTIKITQANPGGPLNEALVGAISATSATSADAGKVILTNASGTLDSSFGGGGGSSVYVNGTPVTNPNFLNGDIVWTVTGSAITATVEALATTGASVVTNTAAPPSTGQVLTATSATTADWQTPTTGTTVSVNGSPITNPDFDGSAPSPGAGYSVVVWTTSGSDVSGWYSTTGTSVSFNDITTGSNATATMTVASGGELTYSTGGVVNASEVAGIDYESTPTHVGQIPIVQPGLTSIAYADPQVIGLFPAGTPINTFPAYVAPTTIQPVLIGASDGTDLQNILVDGSGNLKVAVENSVTVTGTVAATQSGAWSVTTASEIAPGASLPTDATWIGWNTTGSNFVGVSTTNPLPVSATIGGTFTPALTTDRTSSGSITSTQSVVISTQGGGSVSIGVTGTWTGTLAFESSVDGV